MATQQPVPDPADARKRRVDRLLQVAVAAAGVSGGLSLMFGTHASFDAVVGDWMGCWGSSVRLLVIALVARLGIWLARGREDRLRRLGLQGVAIVGRVCAELIAAVALLGIPPVWRAARELHAWRTYYKPFVTLDHGALVMGAVPLAAVCIIGLAWALCARDELPNTPLVPRDPDEKC